MNRSNFITTVFVVLFLAGSAGCYKYVPASVNTVPVGSRVRVTVSGEAFLRLQDQGAVRQPSFEGRLEDATDFDVLISVPSMEMTREFGARTLYQRLDLSSQEILRVDRREIDSFRSGAALAALVGIATYWVIENFVSRGPGTVPPDPPGGQEHLAGWGVRLSIPIP